MIPAAQRQLVSDGSTAPLHKDVLKIAGSCAQLQVLEFEQQPGEILFVPSAWYHQVDNVTDTISINHNVCSPFESPSLSDATVIDSVHAPLGG